MVIKMNKTEKIINNARLHNKFIKMHENGELAHYIRDYFKLSYEEYKKIKLTLNIQCRGHRSSLANKERVAFIHKTIKDMPKPIRIGNLIECVKSIEKYKNEKEKTLIKDVQKLKSLHKINIQKKFGIINYEDYSIVKVS